MTGCTPLPSPHIITPSQLSRRIGLPDAPSLPDLSRMHRDDLAQLDAGLALYDAFFRWCRDAAQETHNWPTGRPA